MGNGDAIVRSTFTGLSGQPSRESLPLTQGHCPCTTFGIPPTTAIVSPLSIGPATHLTTRGPLALGSSLGRFDSPSTVTRGSAISQLLARSVASEGCGALGVMALMNAIHSERFVD